MCSIRINNLHQIMAKFDAILYVCLQHILIQERPPGTDAEKARSAYIYRNLSIRLLSSNILDEETIDIWEHEISARYFNGKYIIDKFKQKDFSFWIDAKGRRVYSRLS